jgi:hypothetical protein
MPRHLSTALPLLGILLLAGCAQPAPPSLPPVPADPHFYVCRLSDAPNAAAAEQHIAVRPDDQRTGLLLRINGQSGWRALAVVAGSNGQVYADTSYAWRANGAAGVLTDIRSVQTYNCTADAAAGGTAK